MLDVVPLDRLKIGTRWPKRRKSSGTCLWESELCCVRLIRYFPTSPSVPPIAPVVVNNRLRRMAGLFALFSATSGLLDKLTSADSIREDQVALFIRQLLGALEEMHNKKIVHLDLKPETILLKDDQIKLADFGQSRRLLRGKPTYGTVGSPEFVSPEIVNQQPVTLATDLWSVGALTYVLYEASKESINSNSYVSFPTD